MAAHAAATSTQAGVRAMQQEPTAAPSAAGDDANALITRGNASMRWGRIDVALDCYRAALALQPDRFEARANFGMALLAVGRCDAAETHLRWALALRPDEAPLHLALARAYSGLGRVADAEAGYRRALAITPRDVEALVELGTSLRHRAAWDAAEDCYRRALALDPTQAWAHYGLGLCLRERGRVADAAASFEHAIAARPDHVDAHYRLAVLAPQDRDPKWLAQLEALRPRVAALSLPQRIRYRFALGRRRENAGDFDGAFAAYAEGNRLQWERLGLAQRYPTREALDARFAARIRDTFGGTWLRGASRRRPADSRVPIFIVGMPRSGTSLVEHMLAAHPAVRAGGELQVLPDLLEETFGFTRSPGSGAYPEVVPTLSGAQLQQLGRRYLDRAWSQVQGVALVTDKFPGNVLHAGMIHLMLPQAKIVHVLRDPRDARFSCFANLFAHANVAYSYDLGALGRYCVRCLALMRHWGAVLPAGAIGMVRYEELVADPERELRRLLDFLDLPWEERCLDFHRQARAMHTVSAGQVQQPVHPGSVARWRRFEGHLGPLLDALGDCADVQGSRGPTI
ncbi:MAG: sulfotransferase [Rhodanobacteraceae bacterium]